MNKQIRALTEKYKLICEDLRRIPPGDRTGGMFEYKGYIYKPWEDREEDNTKIFHDIITPDGEERGIDWSPYSYMRKDDFQLWVDIGAPFEYSIWDRKALDQYVKYKTEIDAKLNKDNPGVPPTF